MVRARLMALVNSRWCFAQLPDTRLGMILPRSIDRNLRICAEPANLSPAEQSPFSLVSCWSCWSWHLIVPPDCWFLPSFRALPLRLPESLQRQLLLI